MNDWHPLTEILVKEFKDRGYTSNTDGPWMPHLHGQGDKIAHFDNIIREWLKENTECEVAD